MKKDNKIIPSGPFKGKKIEFAPTTGIDMFREIAEDFMRRIFGFAPGDYLITDESSLFDFTGVNEMDLSNIQKKRMIRLKARVHQDTVFPGLRATPGVSFAIALDA